MSNDRFGQEMKRVEPVPPRSGQIHPVHHSGATWRVRLRIFRWRILDSGFSSQRPSVAFPVPTEVYVSRLLNREEFQKHCDQIQDQRSHSSEPELVADLLSIDKWHKPRQETQLPGRSYSSLVRITAIVD